MAAVKASKLATFYMLTNANMAAARKFEIQLRKFNVVRRCSSVSCMH